jgi:circadian clock protein KaiC
LGGGPERGTSTLLLGPAGSGKSTVALMYAVAAAERGDHAAMFLFDESLVTLQTRCDAIGIKLREAHDSGKVYIRSVDPAEVSPGEFGHMVRNAVEVHGARIIVIDSLNGYLNAMPEEPFLTAQLHELLSYLGRSGVTTFLVVAQHGMMIGSNAPTPIDTSYLADCVILHRYYEYRGHVKKAVSVVKKRSGRHEETIRGLWFDENGVHVGPPLTQLRGILTGVPVEMKKLSSEID